MSLTYRILVLLFSILTITLLDFQKASAAFDSEDEAKKETSSKSGNMPSEVEDVISALLDSTSKKLAVPDAATLEPLLEFVTGTAIKPEDVHPAKRDFGRGAYFKSRFNISMQRFLRYCFNPGIPGEVVYPTVIRRNNWLPGSQILKLDSPLWEKAERLDSPVVLRGMEFEEITPDTFSGSFYSYTLDRILILTKYKERVVLISVGVQNKPSSVGLKGVVVGKDSDWDYIYTNKQGSTLKLAGWADTFMYSAATIAVYSETAPKSRNIELASMKYLKAGWAKINMVEPKHILSGARRFVSGMKQVLESSALPSPEDIVAKKRELNKMDDAALRAALEPYGSFLEEKAKSAKISDSDFKDVLEGDKYAGTMERDNLIAELLKQYMKSRLGLNAKDQAFLEKQ